MSPTRRRLVQSLVFAVLCVIFFYDLVDPGDPSIGIWSLVIALVAGVVVGYVSWPTLDMVWQRMQTPQWRPTGPHVVGALAIGLVFLTAFSLVDVWRTGQLEGDPVTMVVRWLRNALFGYLMWPSVEITWRRWRS